MTSTNPFDIMAMSKMFSSTYEGDVRFEDQVLIDTVKEMPKWKPRKWWYDIECNTGDDKFTTVIAVIDSDLDTPVVFAWADERTNCPLIVIMITLQLQEKFVVKNTHCISMVRRKSCMTISFGFYKSATLI